MGVLRRLHRRLVQLDGLLGLLLSPLHRFRVPAERTARRLARVGGAQPVGGMHRELRSERIGRLPLPLVRVEGLHALADPVEGRLEVREVLGRLPERRRPAVDQLVGLLAFAELLLPYGGPQTGRGVVTEVLDLVRPAVCAGTVEDATDLVGGPVHAVTDDLLGRVDLLVDRVETLVDQLAPVRHQPSPPGCTSGAGPTVASTTASISSRSPTASASWLDSRMSELFRSRTALFHDSLPFSVARAKDSRL